MQGPSMPSLSSRQKPYPAQLSAPPRRPLVGTGESRLFLKVTHVDKKNKGSKGFFKHLEAAGRAPPFPPLPGTACCGRGRQLENILKNTFKTKANLSRVQQTAPSTEQLSDALSGASLQQSEKRLEKARCRMTEYPGHRLWGWHQFPTGREGC